MKLPGRSVGLYLVLSVSVIWSVRSAVLWGSAARAESAALRDFHAVRADVLELCRFRQEGARYVSRSGPDLVSRVNSTASSAGIAPDAVASVLPEAETSVVEGGSRRLVRHAARISFQGIGLPQLGRFVDTWRQVEPEWTISAIEFGPDSSDMTRNSHSQRIRTTIVIEAMFAQTTDQEGS